MFQCWGAIFQHVALSRRTIEKRLGNIVRIRERSNGLPTTEADGGISLTPYVPLNYDWK